LTTASPFYLINPSAGSAAPMSSPGPTGYTPSQVSQAYGFNQITFNNGTVKSDGSGQTIAIVDAYDDPNIAGDLQQFDATFGLANPVFTKVNQNGGSTMPQADSGWANEIALDVEWAHAMAPGAQILLVEANSNNFSDLMAAVQYAASQPGVWVVSMSWGGGEFSSETSYDSVFTTPAGHQGVTFIASSGDYGAPPSYPAVSPNVLAVGGTSLYLNGSNYSSETGWSGSGGGISSTESQPSYQQGIVTQSSTQRTSPDVSYNADPNTGVPVYNSYTNGTTDPWAQFGGTSAGAPQWAALIAIADQGRTLNGEGPLDGGSQTLPDLYQLPSTDFHDVTSGTSTGSPSYSAGPGYDLVTGLGSPIVNLIVPALVGQSTTSGATHYSVTTSASGTAGSAVSVTVSALDANGQIDSGHTGTVHLTSSDPSAVLPADYTFTAADQGTHTFSVTLKTAGNDTITATDTVDGSITGSTSVTVNPAAAAQLVFGQQPTNAAPNAVITPAVTVRVLDAYGNLVTSANTDAVTLTLGNNPGGTTTATVSGGVATFNNLTLNQPGTGYTLKASSGTLTGATSAAFNISTSTSTVIEDFETTHSWYLVGGYYATAYRSTAAAHDGTYGLDDYNGNDWIYRNDAGAQVKAGDTVSVWLQFSGTADGRAYFGFGAGPGGTLSLVAAPNSNQLILQQNLNYGYTNLAAVSQTYQANHWYRLEVDWGTSGQIVGKLFDSDGKTLLGTVSATTTAITSGGIAFRAIGNDKFWDTVTDTPGANSFTVPATVSASAARTGLRTSAVADAATVGTPGAYLAGGFFRADSTPPSIAPLQAAVDHVFASEMLWADAFGYTGRTNGWKGID
jgi:hypothetical protein